METKKFIAKVETEVLSSAEKVWNALTDPKLIKEYMMGAMVESNWEKGSDITWRGEVNGTKYDDKGKILKYEPYKILSYSHFSSSSGLEDKPENYHTVIIELDTEKSNTKVTLTQDKNNSEKSQKESEKNWSAMLSGLKNLVEK